MVSNVVQLLSSKSHFFFSFGRLAALNTYRAPAQAPASASGKMYRWLQWLQLRLLFRLRFCIPGFEEILDDCDLGSRFRIHESITAPSLNKIPKWLMFQLRLAKCYSFGSSDSGSDSGSRQITLWLWLRHHAKCAGSDGWRRDNVGRAQLRLRLQKGI